MDYLIFILKVIFEISKIKLNLKNSKVAIHNKMKKINIKN
jgi:hypothetical protein